MFDPRKQAQLQVDILVTRSITEYIQGHVNSVDPRTPLNGLGNISHRLASEAASDRPSDNWRGKVLTQAVAAFQAIVYQLTTQLDSKLSLQERVESQPLQSYPMASSLLGLMGAMGVSKEVSQEQLVRCLAMLLEMVILFLGIDGSQRVPGRPATVRHGPRPEGSKGAPRAPRADGAPRAPRADGAPRKPRATGKPSGSGGPNPVAGGDAEGEKRGPRDNTCYAFAKTGKCRNGDKCRFSHGQRNTATSESEQGPVVASLLSAPQPIQDTKPVEASPASAFANLPPMNFAAVPVLGQQQAPTPVPVQQVRQAPQQCQFISNQNGQQCTGIAVTGLPVCPQCLTRKDVREALHNQGYSLQAADAAVRQATPPTFIQPMFPVTQSPPIQFQGITGAIPTQGITGAIPTQAPQFAPVPSQQAPQHAPAIQAPQQAPAPVAFQPTPSPVAPTIPAPAPVAPTIPAQPAPAPVPPTQPAPTPIPSAQPLMFQTQ